MAIITEVTPIMELSNETDTHMQFRFRGRRWALGTFFPGLALCLIPAYLYLQGNEAVPVLAALGLLGVVLLFSSLYSLTSSQWLIVDGNTRTVIFHKDNLYGQTDWERPAGEFVAIRIGKRPPASNWHITLLCEDGTLLNVGENIFGAETHPIALRLADKFGDLTGISVEVRQRNNE